MGSGNPTPVGDVVSSPPETVSVDATLGEVAAAMRDADVGVPFVTAGMPATVTATDVMTSPVGSVPPDVSVREAAAMMTSLGIEHLPGTADSVHGDDDVSVVSSTDVTGRFA